MAAPQVQSVEQIISSLNPAYQGSISNINAQKAALPAQYQAQTQALDASKVQGFNDINNQATGKGLSFSGIPADEQATYLSTKYLPGLTSLKQQQNDETSKLDAALAQIDQERRLKALDIQTGQKSALQTYLQQQQQLQEQQREFNASQSLERAKLAASTASSGPSAASLNSAALGILTAKGAQGKDGFVSPATFQKAMNAYLGAGGTPTDFLAAYRGYANTGWKPELYGYTK